ncbi:hypothetical protein HCN44_005683 [Aphidius gifuensis]|uniref:MoaB/Mog domain-containing protein n=1 Tax=Aphidius gifuensis TaxID=684658 RepID=A0A834XWL2_APHGI|nr:hypothetical protein HCN44_005683 [Aphidius gifuensis]
MIFFVLVSDTCSEDSSKDISGPELIRLVTDKNTPTGKILQGHVMLSGIVEDDEYIIMEVLKSWSDDLKPNVILTTGGTGFSKRDVTPEATKQIIEKEAPGLSLAMLNASLKVTPMAMLSRAVCGIRGDTLIINLPGSLKAVRECLDSIANVIPHAVDLILDNKPKIKTTHEAVQGSLCKHKCQHDKDTSTPLNDVVNRLRKSPYPMISMEKVASIIQSYNWSGDCETINLWNCHGRILADDIYSLCDLPPFRASIKDGYAVIASDGKGLRKVTGSIEAGQTPHNLKAGFCMRINTGAPVPDEATAVVQVEDTELISKSHDNTEENEINILVVPKEDDDIRAIGSDIKKGTCVLKKYTKITAVELGILAACGCTSVNVTKLPKIGVLSTGNELQQAGEPQKPGHVYDSNKITLMMLLKEHGYEAKDIGIAIDDEHVMTDLINNALNNVDVLITTGSVSMGDRDMLKPIIEKKFNGKIHFGRVNMKPGKPTTFATCMFNGQVKYFMCLPGNPVSATVTFYLFAMPLIHRLSGNYSSPIIVKARLMNSYKLDSRPEYTRAILVWQHDSTDNIPEAYDTGNQISSRLVSCKNANALLMLPGCTDEKYKLQKGDLVEAILLGFHQHV